MRMPDPINRLDSDDLLFLMGAVAFVVGLVVITIGLS